MGSLVKHGFHWLEEVREAIMQGVQVSLSHLAVCPDHLPKVSRYLVLEVTCAALTSQVGINEKGSEVQQRLKTVLSLRYYLFFLFVKLSQPCRHTYFDFPFLLSDKLGNILNHLFRSFKVSATLISSKP